jgi:hypothetical protein
MLVVDRGGPTMFARIGVMRALNRHVERVFDSSRKEKHWGQRKLARDRRRGRGIGRWRNRSTGWRRVRSELRCTIMNGSSGATPTSSATASISQRGGAGGANVDCVEPLSR